MSDLVCVVDDDASLRAGLASLLRSVGLRVRQFASADEFMNDTGTERPACLILDVRMPGLSGLECQQQLGVGERRVPIVFVTAHGDVPMSVRAIKAGAVDFLPKPFRDQDLLDAVQQAIVRDHLARAADAEQADLRRRLASLTSREQEVMTWVVSGRLNKQIAVELGTSEVTVKVHRSHVMRKMQAPSLADLVRMADRLDLKPHP